MRQGTRAAVGAAAAIGMFAAGAVPAVAADRERHARVIAVDGVAKGNADRRVEILVHVPAGKSAKAAGDRALAGQGAVRVKTPEPPTESGYSFTGLRWTAFPVRQSYNGAGSPTGGAQTALNNTYGDWSNVSGSNYRIQSGGTTTRCPSLVRECRGPQRNDGFNDVGWAPLSGTTLGVTWSTSGRPEADMAINTRYTWVTGCRNVSGAFDLETVYLHENGHVAGLGHSTDINAVMYPSYQAARCTLAADDRAGIAALY